MATTGAEYEIEFVEHEGQIVPRLTSGLRARQIVVRNRAAYEHRMFPGARFAVSLIHHEGPARFPTCLTLHIERQIIKFSGTGIGDDFWIEPNTWQLIKADVHFGRAIRLVGPKGSGKTTFAALLAKVLGVPFIKVDGTGIFKPKDLFGAETGEKGTMGWVKSDLALFLERHRERKCWPRAVVCLDEFSRMGHSMAPFHALFDDTRQFSFTTCEGTIIIDGLDGIIWVLTDNPVGPGYVGNQSLDSAMNDRVEVYAFGYPPPTWEVPWLVSKTGITQTEAAHIVQVANAAREQAVQHGWEEGGPSPRRTLRAAQDAAFGIPLLLAVTARIIDRYPDGDAQSERRVLTAHLKGCNLITDLSHERVLMTVGDITA